MASPTLEHRSSSNSNSNNHSNSSSTSKQRDNGRASPRRPAQTQQQHDPESSPKRKQSEAGNGTHDSNGDSGKKKRRKVNHACVYCRRSHMTCDLERPCARCIKRDIGHLCHDEPRDPPKRSKSDVGVAEIAPAPGDGAADVASSNRGSYARSNGDTRMDGSGGSPAIAQPSPLSPTPLQRPAVASATTNTTSNGGSGGGGSGGTSTSFMQSFDWGNNGVHSQFQDMHHLHPNYMFNTSEATNEYNLLNDFLSTSLLDDGAMYSDDTQQALFSDPLLATSSMNALALSLPNASANSTSNPNTSGPTSTLHAANALASAAGHEISRPSSTFPVDSRARDKFYMTAADPAGLSSAEDRLHKLLKAKYDAGMLKPFNHVKGYARLNAYMASHLSRASQLRILKQLDRFRPKFREAMQTLTDMQLVLVEMWVERKLMQYDRVFASMAVPACCWRRTGEIFRGNTEMAELLRCPRDQLRDGRLAIHEIIAEDSLVSYWEKFGAIAFDGSQKAILTSCLLKRPETRHEQQQQQKHQNGNVKGPGDPASADRDAESNNKKAVALATTNSESTTAATTTTTTTTTTKMTTIRCCFSFTIRRDSHNIPSLIVGNFLPIQPHPT